MSKKYKTWTAKEKFEIIKPILDGKLSIAEQSRILGYKSPGTIGNWVVMYNKKGMAGLENKKKPGNPMAKYSNRKELTYTEQLEYENMKLRIENERLKKGYLVKGDGTVLISTLSNKKNSK